MLDQQQKTPSHVRLEAPPPEAATAPAASASALSNMDELQRYRRIRRFFLRSALHLLWWDILLNAPGLRAFRQPPIPRWQRLAAQYRALALESGGMLIKLGQFLSIRVDLFPAEVLSELSDMQDELPPEDPETMIAQIEADLQRPIAHLFSRFVAQPVGAASLAQVHMAYLPSGEEVVIKVLRPGIERLIDSDLQALALALRWLKSSAQVRKQYDLDRLMHEFTTVTRNELNLQAEADHIERFAADFAHDPHVYLPRVYRSCSGARTLTMEYVGYIKIANIARLEEMGISRAAVAHQLFTFYMQQFFVTSFVHADPHPGNVFIKPLPLPEEIASGVLAFGPGDAVPYQPDRPFQIVLVDFGMVTTVPEQLRAGMREYIIGIGTGDARRVVQSFVRGGLLPPDADIKRMEEAYQTIFDRFGSGYLLGQLNNIDMRELNAIGQQYSDLAASSPIQMRADMLFVFRAMGLLAGLTTYLDPDFDAGKAARPFAEQLLQKSLQEYINTWMNDTVDVARLLLTTPVQVGRFVREIREGRFAVQTSLTASDRRILTDLKQSVNGLTLIVILVGGCIAGVIWRIGNLIARRIETDR